MVKPLTSRMAQAAVAAALACVMAGVAMAAESNRAQAILEAAGVRGGLVVHLGCGDGRLTAALSAGKAYLVQGLDADPAAVEKARAHVRAQGLYGRVSVDRLTGDRLPYVDNLVNLVVADGLGSVPMTEVMRVLAPGGVACIGSKKTVKPRPETIDEWTHYLHDATGNPVASDEVVGPPRRLQWVSGPRWARHHDHMASMTALVAAGGRLFYIMDEGPTASIQLPAKWRLVARDAFSGTLLWKRDITSWNTHQWPLKSGPAHLTRRLVAVGDRVYTTLSLEAPVTALDAATGETALTYPGSEHTREIIASDGTLFLTVDEGPSRLPEWRRRHSYVWSNSNRANREWAWEGRQRRLDAYDAASGRRLWQVEAPVAPCSVAADSRHLIFYDGEKVVCLDRRNGKTAWKSEPIKANMPVYTSTGPRTLLHGDVVLFAGNNGRITALDADTGKTLWHGQKHPSGHQSLKDCFVVDGLVWSGAVASGSQSGIFTGRDPRTGKVKKEFPPDVKIYWFHHRCYPAKATERYIMTSRTGIEFIDPKTEHWETHHWVRGGCIYGILPCNGLVYAPMHSCGCYLEAKLNGFNAMAPGPVPEPAAADLADTTRLERGPAYDETEKGESKTESATDWPTFRHDAARSGATPANVPADLKLAWSLRLGGRLSAPIAAGGRAYVASVNNHAVHAVDLATGRRLWTFTAGGRVDSPPTLWRDRCLFGSADGYVYCLRASDGTLAWRFRAAPLDRRLIAFDQVESAWRVHGSVLVVEDALYCTAGRSMYLDGGIRFLRLDPATGRKLGEAVWDEQDPEAGRNMQMHVQGLNMAVALSDVLSFDGEHLYMRSQRITRDGTRLEIPVTNNMDQHDEASHLFCQIGFLDDSWFHRSFWTYGRRVTGGYGGWFRAARFVPSGRILAVDADRVYGYGRKPQYFVNASVLEYHLFGSEKTVSAGAAERVSRAGGKMNRRSTHRNADSSDWKLRRAFPTEDLTAARYQWSLDQPALQVRAMVAAGNALAVAGHPDFIDERRAFRLPDDPEVQRRLQKQAEALEGRHGGQLWLVGKTDGRAVARYRLDAPPIFDGMAVAGGRLLISAMDGSLLCLSDRGAKPLDREGDGAPVQVISDEPGEPDYLKPPEVDKSADFSRVTRCKVVQSKLGYRLIATGDRKQAGLAISKLTRPLSGRVTFRTRMMVPGQSGFLVNGFIAFGDGPVDERLVKCGIRFKPQKLMIVQGGLGGDAKVTSSDVKAPAGEPVDVIVRLDLAAERVSVTANGATAEAKLAGPLKSITHVGFAMDNAVVDFTPLKVEEP